MSTYRRRTVLATAAAAGTAAALGTPRASAQAGGGWQPPADPVTVDLGALFDNDGIATAPARDGNFDGSGYAFPGEQLPAAGTTTVAGTPYLFPSDAAGARNNLVANGQRIPLPQGGYYAASLLTAGSYGNGGGTVTVSYADGSTTTGSFAAPDWYQAGAGAPLHTAFRYAPNGQRDDNPVGISVSEVWMDPSRQAVALTLPPGNPAQANETASHIFALTLRPAARGRSLALTGARSTTSLLGPRAWQSVEATVTNSGTVAVTPGDRLRVLVDAPHLATAAPAEIQRLEPGEQARVRIAVRTTDGTAAGTSVTGTVLARAGSTTAASQRTALTVGIPRFQPTDASLATHQAPYWFQDAKFGIFIHWGVYSVPAWAPVGGTYAEWYWNSMQSTGGPTYTYHAQKYGESFAYDDFIPSYTAAKFDPRAWVELFAKAGARYYVLTSKHHEGFANWDSAVSGRCAGKLGPHRDLVKELFEASRRHTPQLKNGLYYSLPEWFNPDNPWMGHAPRNPYTLQPVPYTGYTAGRDYVSQYQTPQVMELIHGYAPDILWFDIGGANDSLHTVSELYNSAYFPSGAAPKDVAVDDRGGIAHHDFTTPEYTTYHSTVTAKWESSRGLDPHSYGYNSATPDDQYMTAEAAVQLLVDIVSKNGNLLLDIGPRGDGTIPQVMADRLTQIGAWLDVNGEAIFDTTYWSRTPEEGADLRFTLRPDRAFYIFSLARPGSSLAVSSPVPIPAGARITLLGWNGPALAWSRGGDGVLRIDVPARAADSGQYAWCFKISTS
ncbi:alpha-L-fucosidase [Mangrovactinospora gilvigrisea]|uniref:alpha-L-fucosidase n=1 Tax=Mangrovactinospora gilvigrisea TaxID=1428644 RepID=A0A1J7C349_9ACTN|nr:alpha-L-fucosidase [Mangrovactinospora gilvigrisea]OIV35984.1 alpha-L-fucosidase [Mangrovactinospora gilvigrisea]